eukprot:2366702-Alexandrium_andersonii.AAC.1
MAPSRAARAQPGEANTFRRSGSRSSRRRHPSTQELDANGVATESAFASKLNVAREFCKAT